MSRRSEHDGPASRRRADDAASGARHARWSAALGLFAAVAVAVLANVWSARHYRRWDWTTSGLYTLSPLTVQTLHALEEPVSVYVLLSAADPLSLSVRHLLEAYRAESSRLTVEHVDPDKDAAAFIALQNRYHVAAARIQGGRVVADAALIVARGERHHFISESDLVEIEDAEEGKARPRLEEALTGALRQVLRGEERRVCFTQGHGELGLESGGGLVALEQWLEKSNFTSLSLPTVRELRERDPLPDCHLLVIAGPDRAFPGEEQERILRYLDKGGSVLAAVEAVPDARKERLLRTGLDAFFARVGLVHQVDFVFELDPAAVRGGLGETFAPKPEPHDINAALLDAKGIEIIINTATSFAPAAGGPTATPLLTTSEDAIGVVDFGGLGTAGAPDKRSEDHAGPLTIAYATELPKVGDTAGHGPRVVVIGSRRVLATPNWEVPGLRGTAAFVQGAIEWLSFAPVTLDIPPKPAQASGLKMGPEMLGTVLRWTVLYIPLGAALLGLGIALRRRATEGRRRSRTGRLGRGTGAERRTGTRPVDAARDDPPDDGAGGKP
ncbi:MAG: Gldg family protein [Polyangiaceae bacterium]|nr:Gldg family protein [Polyangiaceae bacterium]